MEIRISEAIALFEARLKYDSRVSSDYKTALAALRTMEWIEKYIPCTICGEGGRCDTISCDMFDAVQIFKKEFQAKFEEYLNGQAK